MEYINQNIILIRNKKFSSNTYLLREEGQADCLVVDPGLDTDILEQALRESGLRPIAVLATHGHFDHIGSVHFVQETYQAPYYLHEMDLKMSKSANFFLQVAGIDHKIITPHPDVILKGDEENLRIGNFSVHARHFPGHSNGSVVYQWKNYLFTGDILYKLGLGLESIPREDKVALQASIKSIFASYPETFLVVPGHGPVDTLKNIRENNQELNQFLVTELHAKH